MQSLRNRAMHSVAKTPTMLTSCNDLFWYESLFIYCAAHSLRYFNLKSHVICFGNLKLLFTDNPLLYSCLSFEDLHVWILEFQNTHKSINFYYFSYYFQCLNHYVNVLWDFIFQFFYWTFFISCMYAYGERVRERERPIVIHLVLMLKVLSWSIWLFIWHSYSELRDQKFAWKVCVNGLSLADDYWYYGVLE